MEFFIFFFDLIAKDLLEAIEETCIKGEVIKSLTSTFIALIPKVNGVANFGDFWSIALCNFCYKVISKIIANRLRPILSRALSEEQFGFLKGRQINEASGIAQECLHNIKEKKLQALILEIDLRKAYDCISWDFLRLVLLQCGFGLPTTNWIMGCVCFVGYFRDPCQRRGLGFLQQWEGTQAGMHAVATLYPYYGGFKLGVIAQPRVRASYRDQSLSSYTHLTFIIR